MLQCVTQTWFVGGLATDDLNSYFVDVGARKQEVNAADDDVTQMVPDATETNANLIRCHTQTTVACCLDNGHNRDL